MFGLIYQHIVAGSGASYYTSFLPTLATICVSNLECACRASADNLIDVG